MIVILFNMIVILRHDDSCMQADSVTTIVSCHAEPACCRLKLAVATAEPVDNH